MPDIYVADEGVAIEVETFYGTGLAWPRKLARTIEKYSGGISELWIVFPPLQAMLFLKELLEKQKELKDSGKDWIKFYTVNLEKGELIELEEVRRIVGKAFGLIKSLEGEGKERAL